MSAIRIARRDVSSRFRTVNFPSKQSGLEHRRWHAKGLRLWGVRRAPCDDEQLQGQPSFKEPENNGNLQADNVPKHEFHVQRSGLQRMTINGRGSCTRPPQVVDFLFFQRLFRSILSKKLPPDGPLSLWCLLVIALLIQVHKTKRAIDRRFDGPKHMRTRDFSDDESPSGSFW